MKFSLYSVPGAVRENGLESRLRAVLVSQKRLLNPRTAMLLATVTLGVGLSVLLVRPKFLPIPLTSWVSPPKPADIVAWLDETVTLPDGTTIKYSGEKGKEHFRVVVPKGSDTNADAEDVEGHGDPATGQMKYVVVAKNNDFRVSYGPWKLITRFDAHGKHLSGTNLKIAHPLDKGYITDTFTDGKKKYYFEFHVPSQDFIPSNYRAILTLKDGQEKEATGYRTSFSADVKPEDQTAEISWQLVPYRLDQVKEVRIEARPWTRIRFDSRKTLEATR